MSIENYVCASEGYPHYNNETWDRYYCDIPRICMSPGHHMGLKKSVFEKRITDVLKQYLLDNEVNIDVDLDYQKLTNKPTVNGVPLVGEFSDYIDIIKQEQLENIL